VVVTDAHHKELAIVVIFAFGAFYSKLRTLRATV
jgi:hypothetical protein